MTKQEKNNYAFIDGQNLNFGVNSMGWKLSHVKFREYLSEVWGVTKAYMFLGFMEEHQDLYNALQAAGFVIIFKPLVRYDDGTIKGNVDADLVLQAMIDINRYDKAVIVTGDGDFAGLIKHLSAEDKLAQIVIPNKDKYSSLFDRREEEASKFTFMNDLKERVSHGDIRRRQQRQKFSNAPKNNNNRGNRPKAAQASQNKSKAAPNRGPKKPAKAKPDAKAPADKKKPNKSRRPKSFRDRAEASLLSAIDENAE